MEISVEGLELIKRSEGYRNHCYEDVAGFKTIGYGHRLTGTERFAEGIGEEEAAAILSTDVRQAEQAVRRLVRVTLAQGQFDALVNFCFNLGAGRLAGSMLMKELNAGRYEAAGEQLLYWVYAGGVKNVGLKARREAEFRLWCKGVDKANQAAA